MNLPSKRSVIKGDVRKVCHRSRLPLNCVKAHGRQVKIHYKEGRKTRVTRRKGIWKTKINTSSNEIQNINVDQATSLSSGLKVLGKRGSKGLNVNIGEISTIDEDDNDNYECINGGNFYDGDDEHEDESDEDKDEEEDEDKDGFNLMQIGGNYSFLENTHGNTSRSVFICKTCDMHFPTYHAVLVHVNNHADSSFATIDGENIMGTNSDVTLDDCDASTSDDDVDDN